MARLQDIADMAGVSRTTVSNVLHGKTKRVSQETIDKIKKLLEENEYVPNMGSMMLTGKGSKIIGFVMGYEYVHGYSAIMDSFIGGLLAAVQNEAEKLGYYVMVIGGAKEENVVNIASRWNVDGLIFIGYSEERYRHLRKLLNKKAVLIDTYTSRKEYDYQNVGIDDYDGGYQVGRYLLECGYPNALFIAEETRTAVQEEMKHLSNEKKFAGYCNESRWRGFKKGMESSGIYCSSKRYIVVDQEWEIRKMQYERLVPQILKAGALAACSDYNAIEIINFLHDRNIRVPEQVSIVGFDDCIYAEYVRPRLTTVRQNVTEKGKTALRRLIRMLEGEELPEMYVKGRVRLIVRDSVKRRNETYE